MKILNLHSRASALLLSFFLMSVLVLVGMAVSVLVIHDLRASRTVLSGTQALYAAEGATELGLQSLKENLPGYEYELSDVGFINAAVATLALHARENTVPCEGQYTDDNTWRELGQNESIQIPLFAQTDSEGNTVKINSFYVEFYVDYGDYYITPPSDDVLRWKILGLSGSDSTQAVSEYIPLNGIHTEEGQPSVFGTDPEIVDASAPTGYKYGKFYNNAGGYGSILEAYYPIETFLDTHSYNYLVLTNVVTRAEENALYFRFHTLEEAGVCEYAQLTATGEGATGDTRQEFDTLVKEGENLPVFDFVLYHTGEDETAP